LSANHDTLNINTFKLSSSSEVNYTVSEVLRVKKSRVIIHISSFIHNTVLVQNLKKELEKALPDASIALIKHEDKNNTVLNVFSSNTEEENLELSDIILHNLYKEYLLQEKTAHKCRNQLFNTYFTDNLTALPNLYQLRKDLEANEEQCLVLIKVDNFVTINNFYGFVVGDFAIEEIAKYLNTTLKEHTVYRLSGAEFAFTIKEKLNFYELKEYLNTLYQELKSFFILYKNNKIFADFTLASTSGSDSVDIFSKVSMALKYAQDVGAPFWIYEDRMNFQNDYQRNFDLSETVRDAVKESRVVPYFQAIVDNKSGKITKYECLARLIDAKGNVLSPVLFIPVAKKIKIYNKITKQMLKKSFLAFENTEYEFNINLSIEDIMNHKIYDFILKMLHDSSCSSRVTFELLESEAVEDFTKLEQFINEIKRHGAKVAIDDFGSGYSNFSYLIKIKADYIKIDGSLIKEIDVDKSSLLVVETIVEFAKKLGMKTVAEHVHSSVVMDKVQELGIDYSQGFYIDKPTISKVEI